MRNFKIVIQYEGTRYQGWQRQGTTQNTLQGKFEALLSKIAGTPVEIQASGRTDAGVHALGQTANFHMNTELSCEELLDKLNQYLPEDVAVISCQEAAPRFHARLNAVGKTYCYRIHNSKIPAVFDRRLVWQIEQQLDVDAMKTAAKYLVGTHDFAAFTSAKNKKKSTVRSIESILFEQNGADIRISFRGDGFLFHMVRILTGTLVEVGLGVRRPEEIAAILDGKDRQKAGMLAPASGPRSTPFWRARNRQTARSYAPLCPAHNSSGAPYKPPRSPVQPYLPARPPSGRNARDRTDPAETTAKSPPKALPYRFHPPGSPVVRCCWTESLHPPARSRLRVPFHQELLTAPVKSVVKFPSTYRISP